MSNAQDPMLQIENVESWRGQTVMDQAGERLGKLSEVLFDLETGAPSLGVVKIGRLGSHNAVVPMSGATLSRDEVRLGYGKDLVESAPRLGSDGQLRRQDEAAVAQHYSVAVPDSNGPPDQVRYESSAIVEQRRQAASDAAAKAAELEAAAKDRQHDVEKGQTTAAEATAKAQEAEAERQRLLAEAEQLRRSAGRPPA